MDFQELVKAGNLVTWIFDDEHYPLWTNGGDKVRGELVLLELDNYFDRTDIEIAMLQLNLHPATVYELAYYANHGWNGTDNVLAFGTWRDKHIPWLITDEGLPGHDRRELNCTYVEGPWPEATVLCVKILDDGKLG